MNRIRESIVKASRRTDLSRSESTKRSWSRSIRSAASVFTAVVAFETLFLLTLFLLRVLTTRGSAVESRGGGSGLDQMRGHLRSTR